MDRYIAQKAQQALQALMTDETLRERLSAACGHLLSIPDGLTQTAPAEIQECLTAVRNIPEHNSSTDTAGTVRDTIETILEEWGRQDAPSN